MAFLNTLAGGCRSEEPQLGSQTNWLQDCETSSDCSGLECICGTCTQACTNDKSCGNLESSSCAQANSVGAIAVCDGKPSTTDFCVQRCELETCPTGSACVAGVCFPNREVTASVTIDLEQRFQTLVGFGAGLAQTEEAIVAHPEAQALLDAMFADSGFDMIRLMNRFGDDLPGDLQPAKQLISEATTRIGKAPTLFLYSDTPPRSLKANGSRTCENYDVGCTLSRNPAGDFDYAAFGEYWRASLAAYSEVGILPNYVSIQSNADWLPPNIEAEACRLLPQEGTAAVTLQSGETVDIEFAGYDQALAAVRAALDSATPATFAAPEVGSSPMVAPYAEALNEGDYGALAFHLYGEEAIGGTREYLESIRKIAEQTGLVAIQSEMEETALNTAILAHHTLVSAGGSAYLQRRFVAEDTPDREGALIGIDAETFQLLPAYHALAHFARDTDSGWTRVDAQFDDSALLASAWISPDDSALTIVLINPTDSLQVAEIKTPEAWLDSFSEASITRTVFDGLESSTELGPLVEGHVVSLPARSILTVALRTP